MDQNSRQKKKNEKAKPLEREEITTMEKDIARLRELEVQEEREKYGLTQAEVAQRANITQQQLSRVENGENCNLITFLKICKALGIEISLQHSAL